jgi:hypothetical protein
MCRSWIRDSGRDKDFPLGRGRLENIMLSTTVLQASVLTF